MAKNPLKNFPEPDKTDMQILSVLKSDSRKPIKDIAKQTNLRPSTVHSRIQRLIKSGAIEKFTVKLSNQAVGENFIVFMLISTGKDLEPAFFRNPHIKEVFGVTGEYDLLLKLKFSGVEEFNTFLLSLRKYPHIKETLTMVATINLKEELH